METAIPAIYLLATMACLRREVHEDLEAIRREIASLRTDSSYRRAG